VWRAAELARVAAVVGFALSAGLALYIARPILRMRGAL
jgi:hypothetical protein